MKTSLIFTLLLVSLFFISACKTEHKIAVETPKPIKIEARIDIYLHAASIEDMVSGKAPIPKTQTPDDKESFLNKIIKDVFFIKEATAEEISFKNMTKDMQELILRRKNRFSAIRTLIDQGKLKEGTNGYLIKTGDLADDEKKLMDEENNDRKSLYKELAKQNNLSLEKVEKAFAKAHDK
ncbi:MAG: DUF1318 domain-containing protein [Candidatus Aureabacteria bacterium]|nr:DUF1318 domain-containing protein [Candidatus Auribacterota bacterium]